MEKLTEQQLLSAINAVSDLFDKNDNVHILIQLNKIVSYFYDEIHQNYIHQLFKAA